LNKTKTIGEASVELRENRTASQNTTTVRTS